MTAALASTGQGPRSTTRAELVQIVVAVDGRLTRTEPVGGIRAYRAGRGIAAVYWAARHPRGRRIDRTAARVTV
ncbi:hypothetical protein [Nocardia mangyaensis]|uniref:hypothetical protein n=1 Tax=Nocardia mangyaensis TaxID=2213200 RepID=UPI0026761C5F|nr:hypothetical protein [Nocardia mangyaensis]MDO3647884.1 hypothetical protein [Nocardia mangyaensis]